VTSLPSGTVTFLFTDVEGSTQLLRQLREEYGSVLSLHRLLVRAAVERHRGLEVDTQGDAFFFAFQRASDGVRAAIDAQRALAEQDWPHGANVRVRMGLHTGEALVEDGRYHGLPVHRAARISGVAHGGQVLLSESTRSLLADEEELEGVAFRDLGPRALKDFDRPIRLYRLSAPGLAEVDTRPRAKEAKRNRVLVAAVVTAAIAAAIAVAVSSTTGGGHTTTRVPPNSVAVVDPTSEQTRDAVSVGRRPTSIALDSSAAWVANSGSGTVTRIDASTRATSTIGGFESAPYALAAGAGRVWATEETAGLASVNVTTQTVSAPVPLQAPGGFAYSAQEIAYGFGSLWIGGGLPDALVLLRVDPSTERIVSSVRVGSLARHSIAVGKDGVWISDQLDNRVVEVDPRTMRVERRISIGSPMGIAIGEGSLWVCGSADNGVWRLQARHRYQAQTLIPTGAEPAAVAVGQGLVWAAVSDGTLARIDPTTNAVGRTKVASMLNGVAAGPGTVWAVAGPIRLL
jgi:class 3 adenylate cyclase